MIDVNCLVGSASAGPWEAERKKDELGEKAKRNLKKELRGILFTPRGRVPWELEV